MALATVSQICTALATKLATISGLKTFSYEPEQLNPPVAYPWLASMKYHTAMGVGLVEYDFTVAVVVARLDVRTGQASIDSYASPTGASSVRVALETDSTLGGVVDDCQVVSCDGIQALENNGAKYMAGIFRVMVYDS